ncbi:flagellar hook-length control protein FliK [Ciceribacter lividus]|uniref:flagellar hook-length control protein FliK n=1 Tax=Ciceribacter lividus TaxID=1197950 RepID=UPI001472AEC0|nr:flagellar hook-length control protein FliK [Ciceribacter lividus]
MPDAMGRAGSTTASTRSADGGFSEALEGAERRSDKAPVDDERPAPRIDISARNLRSRPDGDTPAIEEEVPEDADARTPAKARDYDGKDASAALLARTSGIVKTTSGVAKTSHEMPSGRGEVTGRRGAEADKPVARGARSAIGREVADAETDQAVENAVDVPATDVGEVLSLLNGTAPGIPVDAELAGAEKERSDRSAGGKDTMIPVFDTRPASAGQAIRDTSLDGQPMEAVAPSESDADRTFRFARPDGKGQSLTMRVSESGDAAAYEAGTAAADGAQTVAVLDARRYLAPASTSNAANIAATLAGDGEWLQAMQPAAELANAAAAAGGAKAVHTLKIQMTPIELGSVTANLRLKGDELTVHLTVESHAALRQLSDDQGDILKALRAQGLTIDHVHVSIAPSAERTAGGDGGQGAPQWQQGGQQAQQGGGQSAGGGARQEAFGSTRGDDDGRGRIGNEAGLAETAGNSGGAVPGGARPDHVYL